MRDPCGAEAPDTVIHKMSCGIARGKETDQLYRVFRGIFFFSMASAAESFRSTCDSERSPPECSKQRSPAATPHVGQGTEENCSGVSSFILTSSRVRQNTSQCCSIWNILRGGAVFQPMV